MTTGLQPFKKKCQKFMEKSDLYDWADLPATAFRGWWVVAVL
jgi:hypothetical protein